MTETNSAQDVLSPEQQQLQEQFNFHAAMAFGEQLPPVATQTEAPSFTSPTTTPEQSTQPTNEQPSTEEIVDPNVWLKNTFGWDSEDVAKAELAELRKLKENPPLPEFKYANDQSKTIHQLLQEGKHREVREFLETQERLEAYTTGQISKENAPDIIKLGMQLSNKLLTPEEIEFQYKQEYGLPKEPVQRVSETDEEFEERKSEWAERVANIEMKKVLAAKMAVPQLEQLKAKLELPSINTPQASVDNDYEAWKASNAKASEDYQKVTVPAINALKAADLQANIKVDDPKNQMQFEVSITPDETDFNEAKTNSLDFMGWATKAFYDDKGNFNANRLARAILLEKNFDKYAQSIARQAVNAERARYVVKNAGGGLVRDFNTNPQQLTQLQQEAERAFAV